MHDETKHAPGKKEEWEARAGKALRPPAELYTAIRRECAVLCCAVLCCGYAAYHQSSWQGSKWAFGGLSRARGLLISLSHTLQVCVCVCFSESRASSLTHTLPVSKHWLFSSRKHEGGREPHGSCLSNTKPCFSFFPL